MSPRRYRMGQRNNAAERTRARILAGARELLALPRGFSEFNVDAVARKSGVARMTVYYQFSSKAGLLEALYAQSTGRNETAQSADALRKTDSLAALLEFIDGFIRVWNSDRVVIRRIHALAALEPELTQSVQTRNARRRRDLEAILKRVRGQYGHPSFGKFPEALELVYMLTSFETFDHLAGSSGRPGGIADAVKRMALATVVLHGAELGSAKVQALAKPPRAS
ncbi:MAG TPA: TetR/AcrR family transcriptional regulator [Terriglobales bacterium]|nr:TetR/AcrR family transcriptional regulator [Terriglobales bacterium]